MRFLAQAPPPLQLQTPAQTKQCDEIYLTASSAHLQLPDILGTVVCTKPLLINCSQTIVSDSLGDCSHGFIITRYMYIYIFAELTAATFRLLRFAVFCHDTKASM